ncbi:hypothetical protein [Nocardia sp. NPDC050718]|uniref:hypothetical protein n=1 Tax=Nocardia sp. NPDC050718 TaxID=3155788 RepID=UPI0033D4AF62
MNDNTSTTTTAAAPGPIAAAPDLPQSTLIPNPRCRDHSGAECTLPLLDSTGESTSAPYGSTRLQSSAPAARNRSGTHDQAVADGQLLDRAGPAAEILTG